MNPRADLDRILKTLPHISVRTSNARRLPLYALLGVPRKRPVFEFPRDFLDFLEPATTPYRYNIDGTKTLYLGEGESAAQMEVKQDPGLRGFDFEMSDPHVVYHVKVEAQALLDLTNPAIMKDLGTNETELTKAWLPFTPNAPTQVLGDAVYASGLFEGIRYRSAPAKRASKDAFCVALFKERMRAGSKVELFDSKAINPQQW